MTASETCSHSNPVGKRVVGHSVTILMKTLPTYVVSASDTCSHSNLAGRGCTHSVTNPMGGDTNVGWNYVLLQLI